MQKQIIKVIVGIFLCAISYNTTGQIIKALDKPFKWINKPDFFIENADSSLTIKCKKGDVLFSSPFGDFQSSSCPMLLFEPSAEFIFNAKATTEMKSQWDAAQLVVWRDSVHWAKIYLEKTHYGKPVVGSIVTRGMSDDCNSVVLDKPEIYLQVAKINDCIFFYYSSDGLNWIFIRAFNFAGSAPLLVGFSCESTFNEQGTTANFSHIRYKNNKPADIFNGR